MRGAPVFLRPRRCGLREQERLDQVALQHWSDRSDGRLRVWVPKLGPALQIDRFAACGQSIATPHCGQSIATHTVSSHQPASSEAAKVDPSRAYSRASAGERSSVIAQAFQALVSGTLLGLRRRRLGNASQGLGGLVSLGESGDVGLREDADEPVTLDNG